MDFINEPSKQIAVTGEFDVAVAGGGIAGVASALAAARQGKRTVLIEKQFLLGGLGTLGLITIYLPLCDGCGKQVSFGIAEELLRLSMSHGYEAKYPKPWLENGTVEEKSKRRFEVQYNAAVFAILCEQLLIENGVKIMYGTSVCDVNMSGESVTHLYIENKSGRQAIKCGAVVDCTGDADIFKLCGAKTTLFEQKNILAGWYYYLKNQKMNLKMLGFSDIPDKYKTEEDKNKDLPRYQGVDGDELSKMMIDSHKFLLDDFLSNGDISENYHLSTIATIPQIRMTRRLCGEYTLDDSEMHEKFDDSIGMCSDWRKSGPVYEIPFRTLYGSDVGNVISAGRCISVTDAMWDVSRVIPVCAVTGEAAGIAAAMCSNGGDFASLDVAGLQNRLQKGSVVLHEEQL